MTVFPQRKRKIITKMNKLSVSILMHPKRLKYREYLVSRLGPVPIALDDGCGLIENGKRAWRMYDKSAKYHLVLDDDAIVCDDFHVRAEKILIDPSLAYSFYFGIRKKFKDAIDDAYRHGAGRMDSWLHFGVAICLPTRIIPEMLAYIDTVTDLHPQRHFDTRIARYIKSKGMRVYYPIPSLIDHRHEEESLVKDMGGTRKAQYFIDNEK